MSCIYSFCHTRSKKPRLEELSVFGGDYPTPDGTGLRDYIQVLDLAQGHLAALRYLDAHEGVLTVNLGTGRGYSVMEMVRAFERASGRAVPVQVVARRPGDIAACYADPSLAARFPKAEALQVVRELRQEEKRGAVSIIRAADWLAGLAA